MPHSAALSVAAVVLAGWVAQAAAQGAPDGIIVLGTARDSIGNYLSGKAPLPGLRIVPGQGILHRPIGNEVDTLASLLLQGDSATAATRQFMASFGMTSATGSTCSGAQCGNVTLYTAMRQMPGSTDAWAQNILVTAEPGTARYLQALEIDVNNARGESRMDAANWVGGITLTGTNAQVGFLNRQALLVSSGSPRALWHAGLLGDDASVHDALVYDRNGGGTYSYWNQSAHKGATVFDQGTAPVSLALSGAYSHAAIATENAATPIALAAGEGQKVCFKGGDACVVHASGKLTYSVGGVALFSVADTTGDVVFKGRVTANGTP